MTNRRSRHSDRSIRCRAVIAWGLVGALVATPAAAAAYKWVDKHGVTHYGSTIPPEYADRSSVELDERGRVIRTEEVLTPEQRQARDAAAVQQRNEARLALEQQRRDKALLNTYRSEQEIDVASNRDIQLLTARQHSIQLQLSQAEDNLAASRADAKSGTDSLAELNAAQAKVARLSQALRGVEEELRNSQARYASDKARYRELMNPSVK